MLGHYDHWAVFPNAPRTTAQADRDATNARKNAPSNVLREAGVVLAAVLSFAFGTNLLLALLHIS